jgi:hypothetical protein
VNIASVEEVEKAHHSRPCIKFSQFFSNVNRLEHADAREIYEFENDLINLCFTLSEFLGNTQWNLPQEVLAPWISMLLHDPIPSV